jgi:hypothetical protein
VWHGDLSEMRRDDPAAVRETSGVYRTRKRRVAR